MAEFDPRMLYSAQLLGHHPHDPLREFGFVAYAEEGLDSLKEAIEEEFDKMSDDFKAKLQEGMKSFSSHVMKVIQKTLFKLESAALHNMHIPKGTALPEDGVDPVFLRCTADDEKRVNEKLCETPERLKALKFLKEKLKEDLEELDSAQSFVESRLQTVQTMKDKLRTQGVISPVESTSYNIQKLGELGDRLKLLLDPDPPV